MFCPGCGRNLKPARVVTAHNGDCIRAAFDCRCGYSWIWNTGSMTLDAIDRGAARDEARAMNEELIDVAYTIGREQRP